ncbi:MAG: hypothetical protein ACKVT2_03210 [Saprospiraceae bacterium]
MTNVMFSPTEALKITPSKSSSPDDFDFYVGKWQRYSREISMGQNRPGPPHLEPGVFTGQWYILGMELVYVHAQNCINDASLFYAHFVEQND